MRKRFVTTIIVCLAAVLCAVGLAACGNTNDLLAGKTYEYYEITIDFPADVDEETKNMANAGLESLKALYNGSTIAFEDGEKFTMTAMGQTMGGTYTKNENKITLKAESQIDVECTLDGDVITVKQENSGVSMNIKYKLKSND